MDMLGSCGLMGRSYCGHVRSMWTPGTVTLWTSPGKGRSLSPPVATAMTTEAAAMVPVKGFGSFNGCKRHIAVINVIAGIVRCSQYLRAAFYLSVTRNVVDARNLFGIQRSHNE